MIINHSNINYSNFIYHKPTFVDDKKCYLSKINYRHNGQKKGFFTQTPIITINNIKKHDDHYNMEININNNKFYNLIHNIDKLNIKAVLNSRNWFPGSVKRTIGEIYKYPIKSSIDNESSIYLKIPIINGSIKCNIYNKNNVATINKIKAGMDVISIIELKGIVFEVDSFYPLWEVSKITICDDETRCLFEDGSDEVIYSDIETDAKII